MYRRRLNFEDVWALFGEGRHPHIEALFERCLGPWLSQAAFSFWSERLWYFHSGLYYQGGMVRTRPFSSACISALSRL